MKFIFSQSQVTSQLIFWIKLPLGSLLWEFVTPHMIPGVYQVFIILVIKAKEIKNNHNNQTRLSERTPNLTDQIFPGHASQKS